MDVSSPTIAIAATPADRLAGHSAERLADRLAWVFLVMLGVVAALTFRDYGLGWDDFTHAQYGDLLLSLEVGPNDAIYYSTYLGIFRLKRVAA